MSKSQTLDMTKGHPLPLLIKFAIPLVLGSIFQQLYSFVDTAIVGRCISVGVGFFVRPLLYDCMGCIICIKETIGLLTIRRSGISRRGGFYRISVNYYYLICVPWKSYDFPKYCTGYGR